VGKKKKSKKKAKKAAAEIERQVAAERQRMLAEVQQERANILEATNIECSRLLDEAHREVDLITQAARDAARVTAARGMAISVEKVTCATCGGLAIAAYDVVPGTTVRDFLNVTCTEPDCPTLRP
jgi:hypothetical protein